MADEHRAALGLGVERDDPDRVVLALGVQLADGMDEAHRGLAAIDDGETAKRALGHGRHGWHARRWGCNRAEWSSCNPPRGGRRWKLGPLIPDAVPIWGGTDVMVELNFARKRPDVLAGPHARGRAFALGSGGRVGPDRRGRVVHAGDRRARRSRCPGWRWRRGRSARRRSATGGRSGGTSDPRRRRATRCRRCSRRAPTVEVASVRGVAAGAGRRVHRRAASATCWPTTS